MAAEYQLYIKDEIEKKEVTNIFSKLHWQFLEEENISRGFAYSFTDLVGFLLSFITRTSAVEMGDRRLLFRSIITFRYINKVPFITPKMNMIRFILEFVKTYDREFLLLFNGEIVIIQKSQEHGLVLSNADFWNNELLKEMKYVEFTRSNFQVL